MWVGTDSCESPLITDKVVYKQGQYRYRLNVNPLSQVRACKMPTASSLASQTLFRQFSSCPAFASTQKCE